MGHRGLPGGSAGQGSAGEGSRAACPARRGRPPRLALLATRGGQGWGGPFTQQLRGLERRLAGPELLPDSAALGAAPEQQPQAQAHPRLQRCCPAAWTTRPPEFPSPPALLRCLLSATQAARSSPAHQASQRAGKQAGKADDGGRPRHPPQMAQEPPNLLSPKHSHAPKQHPAAYTCRNQRGDPAPVPRLPTFRNFHQDLLRRGVAQRAQRAQDLAQRPRPHPSPVEMHVPHHSLHHLVPRVACRVGQRGKAGYGVVLQSEAGYGVVLRSKTE
jgi:hypothetical protein